MMPRLNMQLRQLPAVCGTDAYAWDMLTTLTRLLKPACLEQAFVETGNFNTRHIKPGKFVHSLVTAQLWVNAEV